MNKARKVILTLLVFVFGLSATSVTAFAEDSGANANTTDTTMPVPPNGSPEGVPSIPGAEEDKLPSELEDQEQIQKEIIKKPIETPASVTGEKHQGSGTVIDFTVTGSKAFYTVEAQDNTLYYLIIDLDKTENNVYFLSEINGEQLSLGEVTSKSPTSVEPPSVSKPKEGNDDAWFYVITALALLGFFVYMYFKKLRKIDFKKKFNKGKSSENQEPVNEDDIYEDDIYEEEYIDEE